MVLAVPSYLDVFCAWFMSNAMSGNSSTFDAVFQRLIIDDEGRACRDIPDSACREEPRNFAVHVGSLTLSKSADALIDPKLVLSWLLTSLGAPALVIGLLVPVREAGALLPQLFTAASIRGMPLRKFAWAGGAAVQGACAIGIAAAAFMLDGAMAAWVIIGLLAVLAIARSVCSVSYKDVLGKTVSKSRRGSATGLAGSLAAIVAITFAALLVFQPVEKFTLVLAALCVAGGAWILGAAMFTSLEEKPGASEGGASAFQAARDNVAYLTSDPQLRRFILVRGLLTVTALAPPFMIAAAAGQAGNGLEGLGFLVFASAAAAFLSSYVWGRLSDRSSRWVLILSGAAGALALAGTGLADRLGWLEAAFVLPTLLFGLMIAYQGVRLGRSTHLVDMASEDTRAAHTALSNSIIGVVLLCGGAFGLIAEAFGAQAVLWLMSGLSALAGVAALGLEEVQAAE